MLKTLLIAALLLVACTPDAPKVANRTPAERAARAEEKLAVPPVPRTYPVGKSELVVVDVPVADGQNFVDRQRCFIYRDSEFKQSTMSCGQQPETLVVAP